MSYRKEVSFGVESNVGFIEGEFMFNLIVRRFK